MHLRGFLRSRWRRSRHYELPALHNPVNRAGDVAVDLEGFRFVGHEGKDDLLSRGDGFDRAREVVGRLEPVGLLVIVVHGDIGQVSPCGMEDWSGVLRDPVANAVVESFDAGYDDEVVYWSAWRFGCPLHQCIEHRPRLSYHDDSDSEREEKTAPRGQTAWPGSSNQGAAGISGWRLFRLTRDTGEVKLWETSSPDSGGSSLGPGYRLDGQRFAVFPCRAAAPLDVAAAPQRSAV